MPALPELVALSSGGSEKVIPAAFDIASILVQLAIIIVVARLAGFAASKVGIPPVVGEIAAGVLLGPSLLGEDLSRELFPADTEPLLKLLASIGLVLFMFVVGLELDISLVKGRGRVAGSVSVASIALPFGMGVGLATFLSDDLRPAQADFLPFALFIGASMSITAFPVLARILTDRRMHRTETGGLALACAATDDVLAWTLLAVVIGIAGGDSKGPDWLVFLAIPFALVAIFVVRPALTVLTGMYTKAGELTPAILSVVLVGLVLFSASTEYLHVHFIFGAFLFGAVMPHEHAAAMRHEILVRLEQISVLLLLPVFFLVSGLQVNIRGLGAEHILPLVAILAVAIVGKYVGAYVGARSAGVPHWQANSLGILMNTRGLTELVILTVGLELKLLSTELFTMMVIMALVTTVMTGPLLQFAYPARRVNRDIAEAERAALGDAASDRALVIAQEGRNSQAMVELAANLLEASTRSTEIVVAALAPQVRKLEVGTGLSGELAEMAAAMERQEALVRRGRELGVPVRIIANPSADPETDLTELVVVLAPQFFVAWTDDEVAARVSEHSPSPVLTVAPGLDALTEGSPVRVSWTQSADGDAALLLGCRVAAALGSPLVVDGDGRRVERLRETLGERGVLLADPDEGTFPITFGTPGGHSDVIVRADQDANPVDFSTADLGVTAAEPV